MTKRLARLLALAWILVAFLPAVSGARPERIKAGISYYSDDYVVEGGVHDLAEEKNLEEVYQFYSYYEAIYDAAGRVVTFKEYERGEVIRTERYRYDAKGTLIEKKVEPTQD